jgi:hypothetical protein
MATAGENVSFDLNDDEKSDALYTGKITGINPTAQINPYFNNTTAQANIPIPFDIENTSGAYWEPAAEIKWLRNRNNTTMQENKELKLEIKVYKKIIKNLLKKKS